MSNNPRVLRMNELTSDRYSDVPIPVRQQLGDFNDKVDVDARSGNGLRDYDLRQDDMGRDYQGLDQEHNGHRVLAVTYHLDSTEPNSEPVGGPGTESYSRANRPSSRVPQDDLGHGEGVSLSTQGNATLAVQEGREHYVSTQREIPGRNERYAHAVGLDDETGASAPAGSGQYALTIPSQSISDDSGDDVPTGTIASVKSWVGDDESRAERALEAEQRRETPRNTLVEWLQDRTGDNKE